MPKESSALYWLSFCNIIIRPLIKIILSTTINDNEDYKTFLYEAAKKGFILCEQHHGEKL